MQYTCFVIFAASIHRADELYLRFRDPMPIVPTSPDLSPLPTLRAEVCEVIVRSWQLLCDHLRVRGVLN